jgi:hypothetical protein
MIREIIEENREKGKGEGLKGAIKLIFPFLGLFMLVILLVYGIERLVHQGVEQGPVRIEYGAV